MHILLPRHLMPDSYLSLSNFWRHSIPKYFPDEAVLAHVIWESTSPPEAIFQSFQLYIRNSPQCLLVAEKSDPWLLCTLLPSSPQPGVGAHSHPHPPPAFPSVDSLAEGYTLLWSADAKNRLIGKDPDSGKDWTREKKGTTEDEMVGWHHWLNGHEFEQAPLSW